jgi:hypothetical protein
LRASSIAYTPVRAPAEAPEIGRGAAGGPDATVAVVALRAALLGFARTHQRAARDPQGREIDRWENEGGRPGNYRARGPSEELGHRLGRRAWAAHAVLGDEVAHAVQGYTRLLRHFGFALAPTMSAVDTVVRGYTTAPLSADACSDAQRDAARSCLVAYYAV